MKNSSAVRSAAVPQIRVSVMVLMGLLAAMSIVFGKLLAINIGQTIRISFENLPLLMAGMFLGPVAGCLTGLIADAVGCMIAGYSINPIIMAGAGSIGLISGLLYKLLADAKQPVRVYVSVFAAHVIGSMIVKSVGMILYFHYTVHAVLPRVPLYIVIGLAESSIILLLLQNKAFSQQIGRLNRK